MKVLRGMYIGLVLVVGLPVILAWILCVIGMCVYSAIRYKNDPVDMLVDVLAGPIKFAIYVYGNWIKYGNKYSQYPEDGFTV